MLKKIALATAIAAVASSAFAMEALDEETLSATTGQAGLTIVTAPDVSIAALRYTDTDGATGVTVETAVDPVTGLSTFGPSTYTTQGTLMVEDLSISATGITTTLDVGSSDATGTGTTSLFVTTAITGLNVSLGRISLDNGGVMDYTDTTTTRVYGAGSAVNNKVFGGVNLKEITLSDSKMRITPGGATGNGITIASLAPTNASLDFEFIDDGTNGIYMGSVGTGAGQQGIEINGMRTGAINIDVVANGLQITQGSTTIDNVRLNGVRMGDAATAASIGQVAMLGITMNASTMTVRGH